ncbi:hypothetical protein KKH82_00020 [Patescibacteria group bacterium]|nr:hypothetical protein [Patescibacteria group bacterium]
METLTEEQWNAIEKAHNEPGELFNATHAEIRSRVEILQEAGFTSDQIRILL